MKNIDWSKAPEGATHFDTAEYRTKSFMKLEDGAWYFWPPMFDCPGWRFWHADSVDADTGPFVARPPAALVWNGEGLPPVGTVCEFEVETDDWRLCEVIAIKDQYAVCWIHLNKVLTTGGAAIRPIKTPEQIELDERLKTIDEMADIYRSNYEGHVKDGCQALYDAGYRKQVQP